MRRLLPDASGALWIGSDGGGLYRLQEGRVQALTSQDGLPSDIVTSLFEDRERNVWIGTRDGLARLKRRTFQAVGVREGLTNDFVTAVSGSRRGGLWVGTRVGLHYVDGDRGRPPPSQPGLPNNMVLSLLEDRAGTLWVGTRSGLWRVRRGVVGRFAGETGQLSDSVSALAEGAKGDVWVGTGRGLARIRDDTLTVIPGPVVPGETSRGRHCRGRDRRRQRLGGHRRVRPRPLAERPLDDLRGRRRAAARRRDLAPRRRGQPLDHDARRPEPDARWPAAGLCAAAGGPPGYLFSVLDDGRGSLWMGGLTGVTRVEKRSLDDFDAGRARRSGEREHIRQVRRDAQQPVQPRRSPRGMAGRPGPSVVHHAQRSRRRGSGENPPARRRPR